jgi:hypothetical protein
MAINYTLQFSNEATTTLAAPITAASPSLQVVSGGGALFPALSGTQAFIATLIKNGNTAIKEIILVTGRSGDNFTGLTRGLEGTGPLTWNPGDTVALLPTGRDLASFVQSGDAQSSRFNYAVDTGSPNNYVVNLTPSLNASVIGMPIRFKAQNSCSGPSTFSDGVTTAPLRLPDGSVTQTLDIVAAGLYTVMWDGTYFRLQSTKLSFAQLLGSIANGQVPQSAVLQWESGIVIGFNQLSGQLFQSQVPNNLNLPGSPTAPAPALLDSSTRLATTSFVNPASLLGTNGYFKRSDGHIVQAGQCNPNGGTITVTLPTTFPNAFQAVVASSTGRPTQCNPVIISNSQFTISNTGGSSYWMAMGY